MPKLIAELVAAGALTGTGAALAATISLDLDDPAQYTTTLPSGSASLTITDLAANQVQETLTGDLTGQQTITGLWLDAAGLSSISIGNASGPAVPFAIGSGSTYSVTQTTVPNGSKALTGAYDLYVKFANNGASASLQGTASESFTLTGTGLSASLFATPAAQTSGQPSPDFDAMMAVTNDLGTAGSGTGYFGAVTPVPLPAALPLVIAGLGGLGAFRRRRSTAA